MVFGKVMVPLCTSVSPHERMGALLDAFPGASVLNALGFWGEG